MPVIIRFYPETEIIAPLPSSKQIVQRYITLGWIKPTEKTADFHRVFPRNSKGQAYIRQSALEGAVRRVDPTAAKQLRILEGGIIIPEPPLIGIRPILNPKKETPETTEIYEYIDSTFRNIQFTLQEPVSKDLIYALQKAGQIGIGARRKHGYGKFNITVVTPKK